MKALSVTMPLSAAVLATVVATHVYASIGEGKLNPLELSKAVANKYAIYSMVSFNVYHSKDRPRFSTEKLGWTQVDINGKPTNGPTMEMKSGLAYDIFEKDNSNEVIWAFRGTDGTEDFVRANFAVPPFSGQYEEAKAAFGKFLESHPDKKVTVTGHSLGGGLALTISVCYGVDAVVFDSSPRIFDGRGKRYLPAKRVMIYEGGEILQGFRAAWRKKFLEIVPAENTYKANYAFKNKHSSELLAANLVIEGASMDATLESIRDDYIKTRELIDVSSLSGKVSSHRKSNGYSSYQLASLH